MAATGSGATTSRPLSSSRTRLLSAADAFTACRAFCGLCMAIRPSLGVLVIGVVTDWIDGPIARRLPPTAYGGRFDLEADALLTLGAAVAAVRMGAPRVVLLAPAARYAAQLRRPGLDADEARWDRLTGVAQMVMLAAVVARSPLAALALPVSAARSAALAARIARRVEWPSQHNRRSPARS